MCKSVLRTSTAMSAFKEGAGRYSMKIQNIYHYVLFHRFRLCFFFAYELKVFFFFASTIFGGIAHNLFRVSHTKIYVVYNELRMNVMHTIATYWRFFAQIIDYNIVDVDFIGAIVGMCRCLILFNC